MLTSRPTLTRRLLAALDATPSRIPVLLGGCGSGRSTALRQLHDRIGRAASQFVDVERTATTPERFLRAVSAASPFPGAATLGEQAPPGARAAFDAMLALFGRPRTGTTEPATFLLDEFLELRTFESFPGLRRVLHELIDTLAASPNRFVLTSRYTARALRLLRDGSARFEVIHIPALTADDVMDVLGLTTQAGAGPGGPAAGGEDPGFTARAVQALAEGRPAYVGAVADELVAMREHGGPGTSDAISALAALMAVDGRISRLCNFSYELRLHRARGYGALKAILEILADEEGLTLTEISLRLQRTPGSTKDYLSWLEDVDLVTSRQKRYSFTDPLLRLWVRLRCRPTAPVEDEIAREIHRYALPRLPQLSEPSYMMVAAGGGKSGIIEID
jgi:hypothetical protein